MGSKDETNLVAGYNGDVTINSRDITSSTKAMANNDRDANKLVPSLSADWPRQFLTGDKEGE